MIRTDSGPISKSQIKNRGKKPHPITVTVKYVSNSKNVWSSDDDCHYVIGYRRWKREEKKYWHLE